MKKIKKLVKIISICILLFCITLYPVFADKVKCTDTEKCEGKPYTDSNTKEQMCFGECISLFNYQLDTQFNVLLWFIEPITKVSSGAANWLISNTFGALVMTKVKPEGHPELYGLAYSLAFTVATLLLVYMFVILVASKYATEHFIELFNTINSHILDTLVPGGELWANLAGNLVVGIGVVVGLIIASVGTLLPIFVLLLVSFVIVAIMRMLILTILLSIMPIAIVLYFFEPTKEMGAGLIKVTLAHILIATIWITVFAVAMDLHNAAPVIGWLIKPFAVIVAAIVNAWLYFKVNSFFGSLRSITGHAGTIGRVTKETRIIERIKGMQKPVVPAYVRRAR